MNARISITLTLISNAFFAPLLFAAPADGQISAGAGAIAQAGTTTTITQQSQNIAIDWSSFSIAANEAVRFDQPSASAIALNRILGPDPSQIFGSLSANGQVFILNPNGVLFGKTAQVNVGGLVASTLGLSNAEFMAGNNVFTNSGSAGSVDNLGNLAATNGGYIALLAPEVRNQGAITATLGTALLAAGDKVTLNLNNGSLLGYSVDQGALNALADNQQLIQADGGLVIMSAQAADQFTTGVVNNTGVIQATSISNVNGVIRLEGDFVSQAGILNASGTQGGTINITARAILDAGSANANGSAGGGNVSLAASDALIQTAAATTSADGSTSGGTVRLQADSSLFSSGSLSATGQQGGSIDVLGNNRIVLAAATLDASGSTQGGMIRVGGDFHGINPNVANAQTTIVNHAAKINSDGGNGKVVIWSDQQTDYSGNITAKDGGMIEISSKGTLNFSGFADGGVGGQLLLDPTDIELVTGTATYGYLLDPHPGAGNLFGNSTTVLGMTVNGVFTPGSTVVVPVPLDDFVATDAGAVYLFDNSTGALISPLTGSTASDQAGSAGITALSNGNYVVRSPLWNNGAGAATWGSGTAGVTGMVSGSNSLVGSTASDQVGSTGVSALSNGNYVVLSHLWNNGAGAATWGDGTAGITTGAVSVSNSLVGSTANDQVGYSGITTLSNGNYVVSSPFWNNGTVTDAGAATWGNGLTGISGAVSASNSLVGGAASDQVGTRVTALSNGNYVVSSPFWNNGDVAEAGAATWGDGLTGISGAVSASNSLVGSTLSDQVGLSGITPLSNGNYVVNSAKWDNGFVADAGAATWGYGASGTTGAVSASNSLVGRSANDQVGVSGTTALSNGNYVVNSPIWDGVAVANEGTVAITDAGAATWGNGEGGTIGTVSASNSLVGSSLNDKVGSATTALSNGNYVVLSPLWNGGAGAATWGDGTAGITTGAVSVSNSLVGSRKNDQVGFYGITALSNGNYVVRSPLWDNGTVTDAGAATWGDGLTGISGAVSVSNSLVGSRKNDQVGFYGITALSNGNYVVRSPLWDNSSIADVGAATWGDGTKGVTGAVSASNSLVGSSANDQVGSDGVTALSNGNYVVRSSFWDNGSILNAGAATWGIGTVGVTGAVSAGNSLVGSSALAQVGNAGVTALSNGNYLVPVPVPNFAGETGRVYIASPTPNVPGNILFADNIGSALTFNTPSISSILAGGTAVTLQASNDITVNSDIMVGSNTGGTLTLQAGRNINLNANITTGNGDFTAVAGDAGMNAADRLPGAAAITLGAGARINAGTGTVTLAANGGDFVNNSGSATPITAGRWLVYSTAPSSNSPGGMTAENKHYAQTYTAGETPGYAATGNWNLYSVAPVLSVAPGAQSVTYGTAPGSFTPGYSGFIDGDSSSTSGISGTPAFTIGGPALPSGNPIAGSYEVAYEAGLASSLGYTFTDNAVSRNELTVDTASLVISATAGSKTYNGIAYTGGNGVSYSGLVNGETFGVLGGNLAYGGTSQGATNAGDYVITPGGLTSGNYSISYVDGALTVNKAPLSIIATADSKTYDGRAYTGNNGVSYSGFVNGEKPSVLDGELAYGGTSQGATNAGKYVLTASGLSSGNYTFNYVNGGLTVNKAELSVIAAADSKTYDGIAYSGGNGVSYSGFVNGEKPSVLDGELAYGGNSQGAVNAGNYVLTASGLSSGNYTFNYVNGGLTVNKAALSITANDSSKFYDGNAYGGGNGVRYSGLVNGEAPAVLGGTLAYGGSSQGAVIPGNYVITANGLSSGNYTINYGSGRLTISPAGQTVAALGSGTAVLAYYRTQPDTQNDPLVSTAGCGVQLPEGAPASACQ